MLDKAKVEELEGLLARHSHMDEWDGAGSRIDFAYQCADFITESGPALLRLARAVADAPRGEVWQHAMLGGQRQTHVIVTREASDGLAPMGPVILLRADAAGNGEGVG